MKERYWVYLAIRSIVTLWSGVKMLRSTARKDGLSVIMLQFRKLSIRSLLVLGWLLVSWAVCLDSFHFLPFRACVGRNLASMELLIIIASIIRRYDFTLENPDHKVCLRFPPWNFDWLIGTARDERRILEKTPWMQSWNQAEKYLSDVASPSVVVFVLIEEWFKFAWF